MEKITIIKKNDTTIVKVEDEGFNQRLIAVNESCNFHLSSRKIHFESSNVLTRLYICIERISNETLAFLGLNENSTIEELFDAFVENDFFVGK